MPRILFLLLLVALSPAGPAPAARAGDDPARPPAADRPVPPKDSTDEQAKEALERFERDFATRDTDNQVEAVNSLRKVLHPRVADRLLDLALKGKDTAVRTTALKGLARQASSAQRLGPRIAKWLEDQADANRKAKAKGDYGIPVDPRTGDPVYDTPEAKEKIRLRRERGQMLAEAVKCLGTWEFRSALETLEEFLQDGNDDLVAEVLGQIGRWKEWRALPALLDLFEMYPEENHFETGSVTVDTGASGNEDNQRAKRKYMAKYGDPDKRRPRPVLFRALKKALKDITGQDFEKPKDLRDFLKRPEVKKKVDAK